MAIHKRVSRSWASNLLPFFWFSVDRKQTRGKSSKAVRNKGEASPSKKKKETSFFLSISAQISTPFLPLICIILLFHSPHDPEETRTTRDLWVTCTIWESEKEKKTRKEKKECETYHLVQSNSVNTDTEGPIERVCSNLVSVLSGLNLEKM